MNDLPKCIYACAYTFSLHFGGFLVPEHRFPLGRIAGFRYSGMLVSNRRTGGVLDPGIFIQGIRSKSKVILYGAGILGTACYRFLQERQYAELVLWVDARAEVLRQQGFPVKSLNEVTVWPDYDYVLVAVMKQHTAEHICKDLIQAGVVADKIRCVDEKYVLRDKVWQAFCL